MIPDVPSTRDLKSFFCEHFKCPFSEFEDRAFRKCLYFHARLLAPFLLRLNPGCFDRDRVFIRYFGDAKNWEDVATEIIALHDQDRLKPRFMRTALRLRVSGRKANKLAAKLFPPAAGQAS